MYFVLYDKELNSIGETYILESWNRTQRATDFDEISIVGQQIPYSANPFLVVVNNKFGKQMFSGLASTPQVDEKTKKTKFSLKDYMTLFNSEIVVDWTKFVSTNVKGLLDFILRLFTAQIQTGLQNIQYDTSRVSDIVLDAEIVLNTETIENVMAYSLIADVINYYNIYCIPTLDIKTKTLTYTFYKSGINATQIKLADFGLSTVEKSFGDYNKAIVYDKNYSKNQEWALTQFNNVVRLAKNEELKLTIETGKKANSLVDGKSFIYIKNTKPELYEGFNKKIVYLGEVGQIIKSGTNYILCVPNGKIEQLIETTLIGLNTRTAVYIGDDLIYPIKSRNFIAKESKETITNDDGSQTTITSDGLDDALYNAVMGLAQNRYQESITLDAQQFKSIIDLTTIDFSYSIEVFMSDGRYKALPVGEIETDNKGKHIIRLGNRVSELTQVL